MSTHVDTTAAPRAAAHGGRTWPTLVVAACAILPIFAISILGERWSYRLQPILPFEITNLAALKRMLTMFASPSPLANDSWLPMQQALSVLQGPHAGALYETLFFGDQVRFQYPPTSLLWLEGLSAVGVRGARALNALNAGVFLLNAAAVGLLAWLLFRPSAEAPVRSASSELSPAGMGLLAAGASFLFYPVIRAEVLGQVQMWIDLLFTAALILWVVNRRLLAGVLIGLACTLKPQLSLLVLWGALWRERGFVVGALACLGMVGLVSVARYGLHNHLAYLQVLGFLSRHGESFFTNHSVNGILAGYLTGADTMTWRPGGFTPYNPAANAGSIAASLLALAAIVAPPLLARGRRADLGDLGAAAICAVIGSPVAWEHHYGLLLPLYLVAVAAILARPAGVRRDWLAADLLVSWTAVANLIPFAGLLAHSGWQIFQAYCFLGALPLLAVLMTVRPARGIPATADV